MNPIQRAIDAILNQVNAIISAVDPINSGMATVATVRQNGTDFLFKEIDPWIGVFSTSAL